MVLVGSIKGTEGTDKGVALETKEVLSLGGMKKTGGKLRRRTMKVIRGSG